MRLSQNHDEGDPDRLPEWLVSTAPDLRYRAEVALAGMAPESQILYLTELASEEDAKRRNAYAESGPVVWTLTALIVALAALAWQQGNTGLALLLAGGSAAPYIARQYRARPSPLQSAVLERLMDGAQDATPVAALVDALWNSPAELRDQLVLSLIHLLTRMTPETTLDRERWKTLLRIAATIPEGPRAWHRHQEFVLSIIAALKLSLTLWPVQEIATLSITTKSESIQRAAEDYLRFVEDHSRSTSNTHTAAEPRAIL